MPWFDGGHMIWMMVWWVVGIGLIIALFWLLFSIARGSTRSTDSPEGILRRRYANGEIDTDEYQHRLAELRKTKDAA